MQVGGYAELACLCITGAPSPNHEVPLVMAPNQLPNEWLSSIGAACDYTYTQNYSTPFSCVLTELGSTVGP